jgi:hypothetical protein
MYTSQVLVQGGRSTTSSFVEVDIVAAYFYDSNTHAYTAISDLSTIKDSILTPDASSTSCSCTGALKELHYTVQVDSQ